MNLQAFGHNLASHRARRSGCQLPQDARFARRDLRLLSAQFNTSASVATFSFPQAPTRLADTLACPVVYFANTHI